MTAPRVNLTPAQLAQVEPQLKAQRAFTEEDRQAAGELCDMTNEPKLEKELLKLCCNELSRRDLYYFHLSPKAREKAGIPDLVFCGPDGKFYGVELKTRLGRLRHEQELAIYHIRRNGGISDVCRTYEQFIQVLETGRVK